MSLLRAFVASMHSGLRALVFLAGFTTCLSTQSLAQGGKEVELDASPAVVKRWMDYVDRIGKQDPEPMVRLAQMAHQSQSEELQDVSLAIAPADLLALEEGKRRGKMELKAALRVFHQDSFVMYAKEFPQDSVDIEVIAPKGKVKPGDLQVILVNQGEEFSWGAKIHFVQDDCYLGSNSTFHKYGLQYGTAVLGGGLPVFWNNASLESGTGVWENERQLTTVIDQHLVIVGWMPLEINLSNPTVLCRHVQAKVLKTNPLTVQYDWDVELGYRYRADPPIFRGKTVVEYNWDPNKKVMVPLWKSRNLDAEKLLSLSLFSDRDLFIHAWQNELKAALGSKQVSRRREVIEFLEN